MDKDQEFLWTRIKCFEINDPNATFSFTHRLARENAWSLEFATRAVLEYKRFMFLLCVTSHPLTPSDEVDQVWHLHLIYTESYWVDFCQKTLGKAVQHGPTKGGKEEKSKFKDWYEQTKIQYRNYFNSDPPRDIWPESKLRFSEIEFTRVNRHRNWIIRKPIFLRKWKF